MEDRCISCGAVVPEGRQVCPICSGEFSEPPAISRKDPDLMICSKCATKEALDDARVMLGKGMNDQQWEDFKEKILNTIEIARIDSVE